METSVKPCSFQSVSELGGERGGGGGRGGERLTLADQEAVERKTRVTHSTLSRSQLENANSFQQITQAQH